jgi:hypothetical protein
MITRCSGSKELWQFLKGSSDVEITKFGILYPWDP